MRSLQLPKTPGKWRTGGIRGLLGQPVSGVWDRALVSSYWATASMTIIWGDYFKAQWWPNIGFQSSSLELSRCGGATVASLVFIAVFWFLVNKLQGTKILRICIPLVAVGIGLPWIYNPQVRTGLLTILASSMVSAYIYAYRYEGIDRTNQGGLTMMHRRYVEYMRSFIWVVAFILVGYFYWEVSTVKYEPVNGLTQAMHSHAFLSLIQLFITVGGGITLVLYGITRKLREMEGATDKGV